MAVLSRYIRPRKDGPEGALLNEFRKERAMQRSMEATWAEAPAHYRGPEVGVRELNEPGKELWELQAR